MLLHPATFRRLKRKEIRHAMIVCSCNALREAQVREIARGGVRCEREAYQRLGCRPQCGQCLTYARQLVQEESARVPA
ncbi:(2Fe-2S)-binding protein [Sandaracinobacteroides sayramensis]|uniref:(2Fe-2S)-binding protein n=1 Tax=Sandaracinobacteroides sayramensis TaxID=2913411 RepID=UPI00300D31F4